MAVAAAPRPAPLLVLLFVIPFVLSAAFYATAVGRQALVDQWERTALAFGQPVDDARYAEFRALSQRGTAYAAATALATGPAAAAVVAGVIYGVFTRLRGGTASYRQVLGIVAHAGVILLLKDVVAAPINYARESIGGATSLIRFVSGFDEGSPVARLLSMVDLFVVWWLVVLAVGVSVLYGQETRRVAPAFIGAYVGIVLVLAGAMAVGVGV